MLDILLDVTLVQYFLIVLPMAGLVGWTAAGIVDAIQERRMAKAEAKLANCRCFYCKS